MKKFKYLDLPQYLFINMISYCCKQKFLYRFFNINMTRNISETNVINCYWMKLCNMVKILTCLVCCVNCICHVLHTKKKQPYTATPSNILQRTPLPIPCQESEWSCVRGFNIAFLQFVDWILELLDIPVNI
jgi:hypothetical protein